MTRVEGARVLFLVLVTVIGTTCAQVWFPPKPDGFGADAAGDAGRIKCKILSKVGDGTCDADNNTEDCGYDGGDCCTCLGVLGGSESCIDPSAPCFDAEVANPGLARSSSANCFDSFISDGDCDEYNNNEACEFDGGDCCSCDCVDDTYTCGSWGGYQCVDPDSSCADDDDWTIFEVTCSDGTKMGDGQCDQENNEENCGYDGGDCCECDCDDTGSLYTCGDNGYQCIDPAASCVDDDDISSAMVLTCDLSEVGNGYCNTQNNVDTCDYDGGDCCECDCVGGDIWNCTASGFQCVDPTSTCVDDDDWTIAQVGSCYYDLKKGDGDCDQENNTEDCEYDGGDCCECTCDDSDSENECGVTSRYQCIDPAASCVDDDDVDSSMVNSCSIDSIGDGYCDWYTNNQEQCDYDGGDCCQCDCEDGDFFNCGESSSYWCIDPSSSCVDDDDHFEDDDTIGDQCFGEAIYCLSDSSCLTCLEIDSDESMACATTEPTDCAGFAEYYCCIVSLSGDSSCSDNEVVVDYMNCAHNAYYSADCVFDDLCDYNEFSGATTPFARSPIAVAIGVAAAYLVATAIMDVF